VNGYIKRRMRLGCFLVLCVVLVFAWEGREKPIPTFARLTDQVLVIDPGHGGEDGGAVSVSGQKESNLNLAIARKFDALMGFYGVPTVMTRDTDCSIHDEGAKTIRQKKVSDIHNRVNLVNALHNVTLISIHQNAFPDGSFHGLQVFYRDEILSKPLAESLQKLTREHLDGENTRTPQKIPDSIYLLSHITCPAVLVECGFLSNPEEEKLLGESAYQSKLAMILAAGYLDTGILEEQLI